MRAFVTGLDGFAGQWLARELLAAGVDIGGGSRTAQPSYNILTQDEARAIAWFAFELTDRRTLPRALEIWKPDVVYHLAAQAFVGEALANPSATFETNVLGTVHLLEAARAATPNARVLYVGSADAYGAVSPVDLPLRESLPLRPANPYGASKAAAETIALQYSRSQMLDVVATRSFNHTGPGQHPPFAIPVFTQQIAEIARGAAPPVLRTGNLDARRDFSDVRDVVRAYRLIVERGVAGTAYNVCSGRSFAMRDIVEQLRNIAGVNLTIETDPARLRASDTPEIVGDNSLLREHTGWSPAIEFTQTLRDIYEWYAQVPHS
jgi:GDP-4-dehydro-6-deoxy-D-mannose reductase